MILCPSGYRFDLVGILNYGDIVCGGQFIDRDLRRNLCRRYVLCKIQIASSIKQEQNVGGNTPHAGNSLRRSLLDNKQVIGFKRRNKSAETISRHHVQFHLFRRDFYCFVGCRGSHRLLGKSRMSKQ